LTTQSTNRIAGAIIVTVALVGFSLQGYLSFKRHRLGSHKEHLATVVIGDTQEAVIRVMGTPRHVKSPPDWCDVPNCDREFQYGQSIPPDWWVVGFDREGHVVWKAELHSP